MICIKLWAVAQTNLGLRLGPKARGLDPAVPRLFIIDGSKALAKAIRRSFGRHTPIQRCQIHYAEFRIMPTSVAKPAWEAVIAVKDAA